MEVKDIQREQLLCQIIQERDAMVLDLNNQVIALRQENDKYKQIVKDLEISEKSNIPN